MYKKFAACSTISTVVVTRGIGDGSSMENASETWLIPGQLMLASYNQFNTITGVDEFHGDLIVEAGPPAADGMTSPIVSYGMFLDYGFCFRPSAPDVTTPPIDSWDCMQVKTGVDLFPFKRNSYDDPTTITATSNNAFDF